MQALDIIFAGSGEFGLPALRAIVQAGHRVVQIYSQPDKPAGRGRKLAPTPIAQFALERGLPLIRTANINHEQLAPADVMVVIAFGQKIAPHVVDHPKFGSVNLHASRLPKYRGAAPIHAAILAGENVTGNSVIRLAQKMDAGAVLGMSSVEIGEMETVGELHDRLAADGAPLVLRVLDEIATGRPQEVEQDHSQATLAPKLSRETSKIEWSKSADTIARQIRGMHPWPACRVRIIDDETGNELARATLVRARPTAARGEARVGHIEWDGQITTGDAAVEIVELQPEGGRIMPLTAFRNGHPWKPGMRVESI